MSKNIKNNARNINKSIAIENKYVIVRRGKKKYFIACFGGENEKE